jgi:hypothetical protein
LLICFFDGFAADGTLRILKELKLPAPLIFTPYQKRLSAGVAFFAAREGLTAAEGANRH